MLKELHMILKSGTSANRLFWFSVRDYKKQPNEVGGIETTRPENVHDSIKQLLQSYKQIAAPDLNTLLDFHFQFERIHPFHDGNGRLDVRINLPRRFKINMIIRIITAF